MYKSVLEIDIGRCINTLIKKWTYIVIITVLFFVAGCGFTLDKGADMYTATATVYAASDGNYSDASHTVTVMNAYLNVASSYKVCQRAALIMGQSDIDPFYIQKSISVSSSANKNSNTSSNFLVSSATIISFAATTVDPDLSIKMADAMAQSYAIEMTEILDNNSVKLLDSAYNSRRSYNANLIAWLIRIAFAVAGFAIACGFIVLLEIFDTRVRTVRDATIRSNLPVLGIIPDYKE